MTERTPSADPNAMPVDFPGSKIMNLVFLKKVSVLFFFLITSYGVSYKDRDVAETVMPISLKLLHKIPILQILLITSLY